MLLGLIVNVSPERRTIARTISRNENDVSRFLHEREGVWPIRQGTFGGCRVVFGLDFLLKQITNQSEKRREYQARKLQNATLEIPVHSMLETKSSA